MASRISRRIVMQTRPFSQTISRPRFARPDHISGIQKDISGIQKDISGIQKDIHDLKAELKTEIKESKAELKTEIKEFKAEFKAELKDFKAELNGRYGRTENQNFAILVTLFLVALTALFGDRYFLRTPPLCSHRHACTTNGNPTQNSRK